MSAERLDRGVWRTRLADGPVVLSERLETVRSVAVGLWFRQGSAWEDPERQGISHLLEHMAFKGTGRRTARDLALEIERIGGTLDAYTAQEFTAFQARVRDHHLEDALDVLTDLAFHPTLRAADLARERSVVLEELAAVEDAPEEVAFELHAEALYGDHPYGLRVAGTPTTVTGISVEMLRALHEEGYRGRNAVVAAAGKLEHEVLVEAVAARIPRDGGEARPPPAPPSAPEPGIRRFERVGARQTHVVAGAPTVPYGHPLRMPLVLLDVALGGGMSSRLFQRIREELGLAYSVFSFSTFYASAGHAGAYLSTGPERAAEALEVLFEELRRVADEGLSREEMSDTKEQLVGQVMLSLESTAARRNRLAGVALHGEPYRTLDEVAARIEAVSPEQVREAAALLRPDRLTVLELAAVNGSEGAGRSVGREAGEPPEERTGIPTRANGGSPRAEAPSPSAPGMDAPAPRPAGRSRTPAGPPAPRTEGDRRTPGEADRPRSEGGRR